MSASHTSIDSFSREPQETKNRTPIDPLPCPATPPGGLGHSGAFRGSQPVATATAESLNAKAPAEIPPSSIPAPHAVGNPTPPGGLGHSEASCDTEPRLSPEDQEPAPACYAPETGEADDFFAGFDLTDKQFRAIEVSVQGYSDEFIGRLIQVNRKTLWRWKTQDAEYRRALAAARSHLHNTVTDRYHDTLLQATNTLREFLHDKENKNDRFRAAQTLMNMAGSFRFPTPKSEPDHIPMPEPWLAPRIG